MKYRKLRIAWSVAWGVFAVLLCVLWVRSYSYQDQLRLLLPYEKFLGFSSYYGNIKAAFGTPKPANPFAQLPKQQMLKSRKNPSGLDGMPNYDGFGINRR